MVVANPSATGVMAAPPVVAPAGGLVAMEEEKAGLEDPEVWEAATAGAQGHGFERLQSHSRWHHQIGQSSPSSSGMPSR